MWSVSWYRCCVLGGLLPGLFPIEETFSKIKALLKKEAVYSRVALVEAIGRALDAVTPEDAKGWFVHCGYEVAAQR